MTLTGKVTGAHAYGVASKDTVKLVFGWGLEGRTTDADIYALDNADILFCGYGLGLIDELAVVGLAHIREAWAVINILATERMLGEVVDVVGDDHEVANLEIRVHAAGSVGYEEGLDAQLAHDSDGEGYLLHGIALVVMETALHGHDVLVAELTEDEFPAMSLDC